MSIQARIADAQGDAASARALLEKAGMVLARSLGNEHAEVASAVDAIALLRWRQREAAPARGGIMRAASIVDINAARILPSLAFAEQRAFIDANVLMQTSLLLSSHRRGTDLERAYSLIFRWKGLLVDSLRRQAAVARLGLDPRLAEAASRLQSLRTRIAGWYHRAGSVPPQGCEGDAGPGR